MYTASYTGRLESSEYDLYYFSPFSDYFFLCHFDPAVLSTLFSSSHSLIVFLGGGMCSFTRCRTEHKHKRFPPKMIMFVAIRF